MERAMSQEEREELYWLKKARDGVITQRKAAERLEVSDRWVRELLKRITKQGDTVVVHGLRGRPSNRKLPAKTQRQALAILKQMDWHDFGPTFAAEQLAKRHQIQVGKETLRKWMIEHLADCLATDAILTNDPPNRNTLPEDLIPDARPLCHIAVHVWLSFA